MNFVIRVDSSETIGLGHVKRCIAIAEAIIKKGGSCSFICREHPGNFIRQLGILGFPVNSLPMMQFESVPGKEAIQNLLFSHEYIDQLGATEYADALQTSMLIKNKNIDWLIVDHYKISADWEKIVRNYCRNILVIDDLADRRHDCNIIVDQTLGRDISEYATLVSDDCRILCGSEFALLRKDFALMRKHSLKRRIKPRLNNILITLGGTSNKGLLLDIFDSLLMSRLDYSCTITVITGYSPSDRADLQRASQLLPWAVYVYDYVEDMAQMMADSDLIIGAAGTNSWERCCLGVPAIAFQIAPNQQKVALALEKIGAIKLVHQCNDFSSTFTSTINSFLDTPDQLAFMSKSAAMVVDGNGVEKVLRAIGV